MLTPVCRVCLAGNVKMFYNQSYQHRELYEKLLSVKLIVTDRPQAVCYVCHLLLQKCCRFSEMARRSERILSDMRDKGIEVNQQTICTLDCNVNDNKVIELSISPVKHTDIGEQATVELPLVKPGNTSEDENLAKECSALVDKVAPIDGMKLLEVKTENTSSEDENLAQERTALDDKDSPTVKKELLQVKPENTLSEGENLAEELTVLEDKDSPNNEQIQQLSNKGNKGTISYQTNESGEIFIHNVNPVMDHNVPHNKGQIDDFQTLHTKINNTKLKHCPKLTPYTCEQCNKSFSLKSSLVNHKRTHTKGKSDTCAEKSDLVKHMSPKCKEKLHTCDQCEKSFSQVYRLVVHKRSHTGEKPYTCMQCGKCFSENSNLVKHMRTHTGEKPYTCNHCKKEFTHKDGLLKHIRIHTGEKPYTCKQCSRSFAEKSNLAKHLQTHSKKTLFTCEQCFKNFAHKSSLVNHLRTHTVFKPIRLIYHIKQP